MRDIVPRIKYEASPSSDENEDEEEEEDDDDDDEEDDYLLTQSDGPEEIGHEADSLTSPGRPSPSTLERIRHCGAIRVLPGDRRAWRRPGRLERRLTATNWQPARDWRRYERRRPSRVEPAACGRQQDEQRSVTKAAAAAPVPIRGSPQIVKYAPSSSKRLLRQLARLRRLDEPEYSVQRAPSVERVERLIGQLERLSSAWTEDEQLLERAERRDLPASFQRRVWAAGGARPEARPAGPHFGRRHDVHRAELESIARAHGARSPRAGPSAQRRPLDRHQDDLAVRRLSRSPSLASSQRPVYMSYLLCSSAYTPPIGGQPAGNRWYRRPAGDDLHVRSLGRPSGREPAEPAFGIPRWSGHQLLAGPDDEGQAARHVSFTAKGQPPEGRQSADSGFAQGGRATASSASPAEQPAGQLASFVETDLDEVPVADWCWVEAGAGRGLDTPALERHQASLASTPGRRRPRISIERPRSKSPLLSGTAAAGMNPQAGEQQQQQQQPQVLVQTYSDSMKRRKRRELEQAECRIEFGLENEDDDDDEEPSSGQRSPSPPPPPVGHFRRQGSRRFITVEPAPAESSEQPASESAESAESAERQRRQWFSIGEYKSLERPGLRII